MNAGAASPRRLAWVVLAHLFAGSVINYMDRAVMGVVMPQLRQDLELTHAEYGFAVNAFLVTYMVFYVLGGRVADRLGCRRTFLITLVCWSTASALHAWAQGLVSLCLFRALLGAGEGMFYPAAMRGAAEWFGPENRAKAVGIVLCGLSVGVLITPPMVAWLTLHYGWRVAFLLTGLVGYLLIPSWLSVHRRIRQAYGDSDPAPALALAADPTCGEAGLPLRGVLATRKYCFLLGARAFTDAVWYFYLFWIPGYFQEVRGFDLAQVGRWLWIPYLSADLGALAGAWVSSAFIQRGFGLDRSRKATLVGSAILAVIGSSAYYVGSRAVALALVSVVLFGHLSWSANMHTAISEVAHPRYVALLYGITGAAGTFLGAITQPLVGHAVDRVGYGPVFLTGAVFYVVAIALLFGAGRIERIGGGESSATIPRRAPA
jgi:ACS family hexuronate transporter-like MFS transporter